MYMILFSCPHFCNVPSRSHGFTEHVIIKGKCCDCTFPVFWDMYGGYAGPTMGSEITAKIPSAAYASVTLDRAITESCDWSRISEV